MLGDALVLATESEPDLIVDVATLTGACEIALGDRVAGVLGNDDALVAQTHRGRRPGRRGAVAAADHPGDDRRRCAPTARSPTSCSTTSTCTAARSTPRPSCRSSSASHRWAHLDIAGPAFNDARPLRARHQRRHRLHGVARWSSWRRTSRPEPRAGRAQSPACLAAPVVLAHPRRVADHRGVVRRDAVVVGEPVRPRRPTGTRRRVHSPSWATRIMVTSLTAVRGSTKPSTPTPGGRELAQVPRRRRASERSHRRRPPAAAGTTQPVRRAAPPRTPVHPTHASSVPAPV